MKKYPVLLAAMWLLSLGSLIGVHFWLKGKPRNTKSPSKLEMFYRGLDQDLKSRFDHYEDGALLMEDGGIYLVGRDFEQETNRLIKTDTVSVKGMDVHIEDPVALERRMMAGEVFKRLNNAEKICLADGHAAILFQSGGYRFVAVRSIYERYIRKYGTACTSCGDAK
jgi:hypothetical protein